MLRISLLALIGATVAGCSAAVDPCDQFAPPVGQQPKDCKPKPAAADQPYKQAKYCYSSLGQVDCYAEPQPGRAGYLGTGD
ncbi:hypothetical protein GCM10011611_30320 [Aliidongia dinghuensis]|uniref:Lipoprotein n=1 Tax=Aliidongia dinghuensis TaxID=1867774 RepID=A0A8J3E3W5_9PROT|nr:hypothetical protein [Aliidongia dinghuensis]GGF22186.1 hypothetical protein GCM10011611_30320 [Aliidongia dinghuensis]